MSLLGVRKTRSQPRPRFDFLAVDLLPQRALPAANSLADLVESAPSLGGMDLDLGSSFLEELRS
jgi:hypothetical protein